MASVFKNLSGLLLPAFITVILVLILFISSHMPRGMTKGTDKSAIEAPCPIQAIAVITTPFTGGRINICYRSISKEPVIFHWFEGWGIAVVAPRLFRDGVEVPHNSPWPRVALTHRSIRELAPGKELEWPVDLTQSFGELKPGRYELFLKGSALQENGVSLVTMDQLVLIIEIPKKE